MEVVIKIGHSFFMIVADHRYLCECMNHGSEYLHLVDFVGIILLTISNIELPREQHSHQAPGPHWHEICQLDMGVVSWAGTNGA